MYITDYFRHIDQVVSGCPAIISIAKYKYGYHYQKSDSLIFRYDNHPYPAKKDIPSCHKHVSNEENIMPAPIPDLEDILKEVIMYLP